MTTPTTHDYDELLICLEIAASMAGDPRPRSTFTQAAAAIRSLHNDLAAARAERDALKAQAEALRSELYRYTDSVDNAAIRAFDEAMGAAVFGGGQPEATSGNTTTHSGKSVQATHSQECPDHEQKPPQPAHKGES